MLFYFFASLLKKIYKIYITSIQILSESESESILQKNFKYPESVILDLSRPNSNSNLDSDLYSDLF